MSANFPGHYTPITTIASPGPSHRTVSNLININSSVPSVNENGFDDTDFPLSSTLVTSPNSPVKRGSRMKPFQEELDEYQDYEEPEIVPQTSPTLPPRTPTPQHIRHPRYYFNDGTLFVLIDNCMFRVHEYHFQSSNGNIVVDQLRVDQGTERHPVTLPQDIKASSFENLLSIIYRRPLDSNPIPIKTLKDACLTAHALGLSICAQIAKYIIDNDCPDEPLDEAVPKYTLAIKLPDLFSRNFKEVQVDKLCCAAGYMSHSHFYELGFTELAKVWKAAFVARASYDGAKMEIYEPQPVQPRASYLIKVKNVPAYRAIKKELF